MTAPLTVIVAGYPVMADALSRTGRLRAVHGVNSTSELKQLTQTFPQVPQSELVFVFADTLTVDTEETLSDLVGFLVARRVKVVLLGTSSLADQLAVQYTDGVGLMRGPFTANQMLWGLSSLPDVPTLTAVEDGYRQLPPPGMPAAAAPAAQPTQPTAPAAWEQPAPTPTPPAQPTAPQPTAPQPQAQAQPQPAPQPQSAPAAGQQPAAGGWTTPDQGGWSQPGEEPGSAPTQPAPAGQGPGGSTPPGAVAPAAWEQPAPAATPTPAPAPQAAWEQPAPAADAAVPHTPTQPQAAQPHAAPWGQPHATPGAGQASGPAWGQHDPAGQQLWTPGQQGHIPGDVAVGAGRRGKMIAIVAPKGGVGKSFFSTNVAAFAALKLQGSGKSVALIDGNYQQADVGKMLGIYAPSLTDVARHDGPLTPELLDTQYLAHPAQVPMKVLLGPSAAAEANPMWINSDLYNRVWEPLSELADYVFVDTPVAEVYHDIFDHFVLPNASFLVVLAAPHKPTLINVEEYLRTITAPSHDGGRDFPQDRLGIVLNRAEEGVALDTDVVRAELGRWRWLGHVPEAQAIRRAANQNELIAHRNFPEILHAFSTILYQVTGDDAFAGPATYSAEDNDDGGLGGFFRRLFGR